MKLFIIVTCKITVDEHNDSFPLHTDTALLFVMYYLVDPVSIYTLSIDRGARRVTLCRGVLRKQPKAGWAICPLWLR